MNRPRKKKRRKRRKRPDPPTKEKGANSARGGEHKKHKMHKGFCLSCAFCVPLPSRYLPPFLFLSAEEALIGVVVVFDLELITKVRQESFKGLIVGFWYFHCSENSTEIRPMVAVVEEADIPLAPESIQ